MAKCEKQKFTSFKYRFIDRCLIDSVILISKCKVSVVNGLHNNSATFLNFISILGFCLYVLNLNIFPSILYNFRVQTILGNFILWHFTTRWILKYTKLATFVVFSSIHVQVNVYINIRINEWKRSKKERQEKNRYINNYRCQFSMAQN